MKKIALTILFIFCVLLLANFVHADAIPPFAVIYLDKSIPNETFYAEALSCENENFTSPERYYSENSPPNFNTKLYDEEKNCYWQRYSEVGYCKDDICYIYRGFPYGKSFRIAIYAMGLNKTFITKEQKAQEVTTGMNRYDISLAGSLEQDGMFIIQDVKLKNSYTNSIFSYFMIALIITIILELLVALIYFSIVKIKKSALLSIIYANLISVPIVWILMLSIRFIPAAIFSIVAIAEIFAVVFEAYFMYWLNKKHLNLKQAFILSLIMNIVSFILGVSLLIFI